MAWQHTPFTAPVFLSAVVGLGVAAFALAHRERPGATPLAVFMLSAGVWSFAEGMNLAHADLAGKVFWTRVEIAVSGITPLAFLALVLEYTGNEEWLRHPAAYVVALEPLVVAAITFGTPELMRESVGLTFANSYLIITETFGPAYYGHLVFSYLVIAVAAGLLLRVIVRAEGLYRAQSTALLVAMFIPLVGNTLYTFDLLPSGIDPTNLGFLFSGIIVAGTILRRQLLDVVPVAREAARDVIIENMEDRVIVLDERENVVDLNPAAAALLDCHEDEAIGRPIEAVFPDVAGVLDDTAAQRAKSELSLEESGGHRYYDVRVTPLHRGRGIVTGHLVSLRDVTEKRQQRQRLDVLNRLLRHNLRNELNVITGNAELVERRLDEGDLADRVGEIERTAREMSTRSDKIGRVARLLDDEADQRVDISATVEREVDDARQRFPNATVETHIQPGLRAVAGESIAVAVGELVANAAEHTDDPSITVTVTGDENHVTVEIADDGPGIPAAELEVLDQGKETALQHGSGVGLWVVNWIVQQFGGQLTFENGPDGCTVRMRLQPATERVPDPEPNPAD